MIPRHRPPFSLAEFVNIQLAGIRRSLDTIEAELAQQLQVPHVVLLPSARFGICLGLRIYASADQPAILPAFTCSAVHEAGFRSGCKIEVVDCSEDSFFMDLHQLPRASTWVLSEPYGQTYNRFFSLLDRPFCILDMAMAVPSRDLVARLGDKDLGLLSFGLGKPNYAGGGGVALTRDARLAVELRRSVRSLPNTSSWWTSTFRTLELASRIMAHWKPVYGMARKAYSWRTGGSQDFIQEPIPETWSRTGTESPEWWRMPTPYELKMTDFNFQNANSNISCRLSLESLYRESLKSIPGLVLPPLSSGALSHFTVRVPAMERGRIRKLLWKHGIDTGDLFGFPRYCNPAEFPNAFRASRELINLPMDRGVTEKHVRLIARTLSSGLSKSCHQVVTAGGSGV